MVTASRSPRTVALNQTDDDAPIDTVPTSAAPGATKAVGWTLKRVGRQKESVTGLLELAARRAALPASFVVLRTGRRI
jgi:hypothetical protein